VVGNWRWHSERIIVTVRLTCVLTDCYSSHSTGILTILTISITLMIIIRYSGDWHSMTAPSSWHSMTFDNGWYSRHSILMTLSGGSYIIQCDRYSWLSLTSGGSIHSSSSGFPDYSHDDLLFYWLTVITYSSIPTIMPSKAVFWLMEPMEALTILVGVHLLSVADIRYYSVTEPDD